MKTPDTLDQRFRDAAEREGLVDVAYDVAESPVDATADAMPPPREHSRAPPRWIYGGAAAGALLIVGAWAMLHRPDPTRPVDTTIAQSQVDRAEPPKPNRAEPTTSNGAGSVRQGMPL